MTRRALSDPALLALYAIGGCSLGSMVALFNTIGFRLADPPFALGIGAASLVFLVFLVYPWVPLRAHLGGTSAGQAASLYLFTYYLGSAVFGTASGAAWTRAGWPGSVTLSVVLMLLVVALAVLLRRTPSLVPGVR